MKFNYRTKAYLQEMEAVKIDSKYKVFDVNFSTMKAFVNQQDTYRITHNGSNKNSSRKIARNFDNLA